MCALTSGGIVSLFSHSSMLASNRNIVVYLSLSSDSGTLDRRQFGRGRDETRRAERNTASVFYRPLSCDCTCPSFLLSHGSSFRNCVRRKADLGSRAPRNRTTRRATLSRRRESALEYVLHFWSTTQSDTRTYSTNMISRAITRNLPRHALRPTCRQFSSSSQRLAEAQAAAIKKLGVIGAGQMVRGIE
jgi:hypothetical protein